MIGFLGKQNCTYGAWVILIPITITTEHLPSPTPSSAEFSQRHAVTWKGILLRSGIKS